MKLLLLIFALLLTAPGVQGRMHGRKIHNEASLTTESTKVRQLGKEVSLTTDSMKTPEVAQSADLALTSEQRGHRELWRDINPIIIKFYIMAWYIHIYWIIHKITVSADSEVLIVPCTDLIEEASTPFIVPIYDAVLTTALYTGKIVFNFLKVTYVTSISVLVLTGEAYVIIYHKNGFVEEKRDITVIDGWGYLLIEAYSVIKMDVVFTGIGGIYEIIVVDAASPKGWGEPHFRTWDVENTFDYHGEGDFLLLRSDGFGNGDGLEIQARTTIHDDSWSVIESVAMRIGTNILQVDLNRLLVDGEEVSQENLPIEFAGYHLNAPNDMKNNKSGRIYRLDLDGNGYILFRVYEGKVNLLSVNVVPGKDEDFESSVGLLGNYYTGAMLARDGVTVMEDPNEFGAEWQVRDTEHLLFQTSRDPQYPASPLLPKEAVDKRRLLAADQNAKSQAEKACQNVDPLEFDSCVFDVLMTGDVDIAGAY
jgi:hypothetical protein